MSLLFSRECEYAIQGVLFLALKPPGQLTPIRELTKTLNIPSHFLAKILQNLTKKGLLMSHKGPQGGFMLGMAAKDITLFHIIEAIDGTKFTQRCILGFDECTPSKPCAAHDTWTLLREGIYSMLVTKNIEEMARGTKRPEFLEASS